MAEQDDISDAIEAFNLSYLGLVQKMLRIDRDETMRQLGISNKTASWIAALTPAQIEELASSSEVVCELRAEAVPGRA
ncbi:flagellar transcriptional regulator FlhD [Burkholderia sp. Ac-20353]|uniref:flagellar transcriptional regulator FlhD n=1 Tax=Burkholderia sp. Ac-20353 TaxID=2703894 RepID=UPI00197BCE8C|nr:flagellar transcriptional regulator FlhD [Burkholderia sp. Ac-20353]MBN3788762.1 flagellar transcriptional regulator FlhD [Burkholderia sp. Ac-20353]